MGTEICAVTGTNSSNVYFCKCNQSRCNNPNLPHYGMCSVCYLRDKTPKQRREFWRVLGEYFNGVKLTTEGK